MSNFTYMPYAKWNFRDWRTHTSGFNNDEYAIYHRLCMAMYEHGGPIPDDSDVRHTLRQTKQRWTKIRAALIEKKCIRIEAGKIIQDRVIEELNAYAIEIEKRKKSQKTRRKIEKTSKNIEKSCEFSDEKPPETGPSDTQTYGDIERESKREIERETNTTASIPESSETVDAKPTALAGLNGATELVISDLARWINPTFPDTMTATGNLRTAISLHGAPVVKQAYGELKAQIDSGDLISRPLIVLDKICQRIKRDGPAKPRTRQTQQDKVAAAISAAKQGVHGHA